jgi:RNA polymerase sigma factor (TIGR02999 family)
MQLVPRDTAGEAGVTQLLDAVREGDSRAHDVLFARVYGELRRLARQVRQGRAGETLRTTALVHEAYLKLIPSSEQRWESRAHFFAVAARAMRQVLVDAARRRQAHKRGAGEQLVSLEEGVAAPVRSEELLALDEALARLARRNERWVRIVEHRFFAGMTAEETAAVMEVSLRTVEREWRAARAWLGAELYGEAER